MKTSEVIEKIQNGIEKVNEVFPIPYANIAIPVLGLLNEMLDFFNIQDSDRDWTEEEIKEAALDAIAKTQARTEEYEGYTVESIDYDED